MKKKNESVLAESRPLWPDSAVSLPVSTDPLGSYTGRAADPYEKPVQDADDL